MNRSPSGGTGRERQGHARLPSVFAAAALVLAIAPLPASASAPARTVPISSQITLADAPAGLRSAVLSNLDARAGQTPAPDHVDASGNNQPQTIGLWGNTALVGEPGVDNGAGAAYVFTRQGNRWGLQKVLTDPSDLPGDSFGYNVALNGDVAMISSADIVTYVYSVHGQRWTRIAMLPGGGPLALTSSIGVVDAVSDGGSSAQVLVYNTKGWFQLATLTAPEDLGSFGYGCSVAASGTTVVVGQCRDGAPGGGVGLVYQQSVSGSAISYQLQATLTDPNGISNDTFGNAIAISGSTIMVGADTSAQIDGAVWVYTHTDSGWGTPVKLTGPSSTFPNFVGFGGSVWLSGTTAMISAPGLNSGEGAVYVYALVAGQWQQQSVLNDPNHTVADGFGTVLAMAGSTAIILGHTVYAYGQSGTHWVRQAQLIDPHSRPGIFKGSAVAISGHTAVIGAWGANDGQGAVFIYTESHGHWRQQAILTDPDHAVSSGYGAAVGVSGSTVVVGASGDDSEGHGGITFIYVRSGGRWRIQSKLDYPGPTLPYRGIFGAAVAISGSITVVASSPLDVYVYKRTGIHWHLQATLPDPGNSIFDGFGGSVAMSASTIVVGDSRRGNDVGDDVGAAYIYHWSGTHWRLQAKLSDPIGRPNDGFGTAVAVSGATAVIGAPGVHDFTGAAYIYARSGSRWVRQATATIPAKVNVAGGFGSAAAVTGAGRNAAVLLSGEAVTGLNTTKNRCGSVFEFARPAGRWKERARVADVKCTSYDEFGSALSISGTTALIGAPGANANAGAAYLLTLVKP